MAYLTRDSHIALSENRLHGFEAGEVRLRYKDYREGEQTKVLHLSGEELIRRFQLHVLPKGLMRIRHCGFLANRCRRTKLAGIRQAIAGHRPMNRPAHRTPAGDRHCAAEGVLKTAFHTGPATGPNRRALKQSGGHSGA